MEISGKLRDKSMHDMHCLLRARYGDIAKLPGMPGRKDVILIFNPAMIEKVFRTEGQYPVRRGFEVFAHYRREVRPDLFGGSGGLLTEHGQKWLDVRSKVNPVMLQPKTVKMYIEKTDQVSRELIDLIREIRDAQTLEAPDTFGRNLKCWSMESIGTIALDERLGAMKGETAQSRKAVDVRTIPFDGFSFPMICCVIYDNTCSWSMSSSSWLLRLRCLCPFGDIIKRQPSSACCKCLTRWRTSSCLPSTRRSNVWKPADSQISLTEACWRNCWT